MADSTIRIDLRLLSLLTACACLLAGCRQPDLNTQYGKIAGSAGSDSLNGVAVFADMFVERGFTVKRRQKISPKINRFGTIVWFPDDYSCPSEEAILALNEWLDGDIGRTLIYVGRDYDSRTDYLSDVMESAPVEQKEELMRQIAEGRLLQTRRGDNSTFFWFDENRTKCDWFEQQPVRRQKASSLSGPLAADLTQQASDVELSTILTPAADQAEVWDSRSLLDADGQRLVVEMTNNYSDFDNPLIVVSNGSFLLNYALVNQGHRQLASNLIDQCANYEGVLFLESGPRGIEVSDSDTTNHNNWAWIAQPPLRYIVPHFLMWGILFCFVFFPIFGRPKRSKKRSTSTFRSHVNAMGKLIARSDYPNRAINKIRDYQHLVSGESKRNKQDQ